MMTNRQKREFESIVSDIVLNKDFNKLNKDMHHGITRYEHSMRVARHSFMACKLFKMKEINEVTRAALLHDFYSDEELEGIKSNKKLKKHPEKALNNSLKYFELNDMQKDVISKHMFPVTLSLPKYKESYLVSLIDKVVGAYEMLRFKAPLYASIYTFFLMQIFYFKIM